MNKWHGITALLTPSQFFSGVAIPTNIVFGFNDNGRKNGEADVEFASHDEALSAMSKNREYIGPRYIELNLHSNPRRRDMAGLGDRDYSSRIGTMGISSLFCRIFPSSIPLSFSF